MLNPIDNPSLGVFLDKILAEINSVGINLKDLQIDHVGYAVNSSEVYVQVRDDLLQNGELLKEAIIKNRRIGIIKINTPINYKSYTFNVIEVLEPAENEPVKTGWEHVEFLVNDYAALLSQYPSLNWSTKYMNQTHFSRIKLILPSGLEVKFLNTPVLETVRQEKAGNN